MAKSALLKSSIVKKYWMALTGLFLCLFLAGHLAGNLQLIFGTSLQFNEYALFMTTNPAVKLLSYLTYISIIFHAIDGIMLTIQNKKARPIGYAKTDGSSSSFASGFVGDASLTNLTSTTASSDLSLSAFSSPSRFAFNANE